MPASTVATARADVHAAKADPSARATLAEVMRGPPTVERTDKLEELPQVASVALPLLQADAQRPGRSMPT